MYCVIESPYAGDVAGNLTYLRACMQDAFSRGEDPWASHGLYTQPGVLDDVIPEERERGIAAGLRLSRELLRDRERGLRAFYVDRGWSTGMRRALEDSERHGDRTEIRRIGLQLPTPDRDRAPA
jgi:hypothetical protein